MTDHKTTTSTSDRKRGRPAVADSDDLRNTLLDSAEELFADQGFAATPLRRIAESAGVNPAMVHYYFGSKTGLLRAVLDRALAPMAEALADMREEPEANLTKVAQMMFEMAGRHPAMPRLIVREVMLSGGETQQLFIEHYAPRLGGALPGLVRRAQTQGLVSESLDPGVVTLMLLSLSMFPFVARAIAEPQLGIKYNQAGQARYLEHLNQLLRKGMEP
jgi:AcrR family transcriptional regulator